MTRQFLKEHEKIIINLYTKENMSSTDIACKFGAAKENAKILRILRNNKIPIRHTGETRPRFKLNINMDYFKDINSPNKAYWLGFLYADGSVNYRGKTPSKITLALKDKEPIENFKKAIDSKHKLGQYDVYDNRTKKMYRRYSLQITSKQFAENVVKCGLIGKGNCADFPKIQEKYYWDFIRGLFDGDGSIVSNRIGKRVTFLGTEQIIIFIHNFFIKKNKFIPTKLLRRFKLKNGFLSQFSIHRINEIEIIFKKMYKHSTRISRLHRKYKKFIEVLSLGIVKRPHWKMKHQ